MTLPKIKENSLFFAPLEGITDEIYRRSVLKFFPEWDYVACDFLRVPSSGMFTTKHIIQHMGESVYQNNNLRNKTIFQILTSANANTNEILRILADLGIPWVDINLGCPANTVCKKGGGSSMLLNLPVLKQILKEARFHFKGRLTAKIRLGFHSPDELPEILKIVEGEGIEMITVHARTRDQMYKEPANWDFIKYAVDNCKVPIIGNGDLWSTTDITQMKQITNCYGFMVARGAMKSPWMAQDYYFGKTRSLSESLSTIKEFINDYKENLQSIGIKESGLLKQSKSVTRFMFDDFPMGSTWKSEILRTQTSQDFFEKLNLFQI
jgi:tRNA-dihydrouridine synthase B